MNHSWMVSSFAANMGNWFRNGLEPWRPVRAVLFADKKVFYWLKGKLGLSEYQMAALVWLKGLIIGVILGYFLFR